MNLLSNRNDVVQNKVVADTMRKNKLESIEFKKKPAKTLKIKKLHFLYGIFAVLILVSAIALPATKISFTASADKISTVNGSVLGELTAPSPSALLPKSKKTVVSTYEKGDNRMIALKKFLESKRSPLAPYADVIFESAIENNIDYRLLVAISGAESQFCKFTTVRLDSNLPTYNCWGWGKNGKKFAEFNSWPEAITTITKGIAKGYGPNPTPQNMQSIYCTSCGDTHWMDLVTQHMKDIEKIASTL